MTKELDLFELGSLTELEESATLTGSRYRVRLIEGDTLGTTGYYPAEVLLRDGPKMFKKGTPMYIDHISKDETARGSFGSVEKLAGELAEDAYYDGDGLYAEVEVYEHKRSTIKALKDKIGISIRARGLAVMEFVNGQEVPVVKEITKARSADFVVRPGAGGKIVSILESAEEDSETTSELEEGRDMKEVLEAISGLKDDFGARLTNLEEAFKELPVAEVEVESVEEAVVDPLEIAEALASSKLSAEGRTRVLDLHRATGKPLTELIEAEEAYVAASATEEDDSIAIEESAVDEVTTGAAIPVPSIWKKDN